MFYTSYFGRMKHIPADGYCIAITRYSPRWYTGEVCKTLAPSEDLLGRYKSGAATIQDYTTEFNAQLEKYDPTMFMWWALGKSGGKDIYLLCYEPPMDFCHRHLVCKWLNKAGIKCEEFTNDSISPWED